LKRRGWFTGRGIAVLAAAALFHGCAARPPARPPVTAPPSRPAVPALRVRGERGVQVVAIEDYVAGCVAAELGSIALDPPAAARARDVQAILCRSFALASLGRHADEGFDLCATTHCQVYRPVPDTVIGRLCREAAARTADRVLEVAGRPVRPVYHADCGGHTSAAEDVWGGPPSSFLVSAPDDACPRQPAWRYEITLARLADILGQDPRTAVAGPLREVTVEQRDTAGRAAWIRLTGRDTRLVRGADVRAVLLRALGPLSLRSTLVTITRQAESIRFEGHGNGHGVGLCQAGMLTRAGRGETPAEILAHYFPGTTIERR
jgi:stage II sporulation protein D (peptidoglycan lytic transglycosylase)